VSDAIHNALRSVASERRVRVLHGCESGSRAWGFASPNSDFDVRFLYLHEPDWYLRIFGGADTITAMLPGDLDLSGWDLRKALTLFAKSNASLFEHLGSPIVYSEDAEFATRLRALIPEFFNPIAAGHHYLSLARHVSAEHLVGPSVDIKKLFYILRPLAAFRWIELHDSMPPTAFVEVLAGIDSSDLQRSWIDELRARKRTLNEGDRIELEPPVRSWIEGWLERSVAAAGALPSRKGDVTRLDALFLDVLRRERA
jgi:hypothetical protein